MNTEGCVCHGLVLTKPRVISCPFFRFLDQVGRVVGAFVAHSVVFLQHFLVEQLSPLPAFWLLLDAHYQESIEQAVLVL